jgi:CHAD domain-containing protein
MPGAPCTPGCLARYGQAVAESRAYRLKQSEPLPEAIARAARGRIDHAIDELRGKTDSPQVEAVHEARKDMKKLRALLRLTRGELGAQAFARENACFRDAARELAGARDRDVMLETLDGLTTLPAGEGWELRKLIQADRERNGGGGDREAAARSVAILKEARGRLGDWPLERDSFGALAKGLEKTYRRGRSDFEAAMEQPTVESLHEWRKRVKDLWYHERLLKNAWPAVLEAQADEAHTLSDLLGDEHDMAVLAERLDDDPPTKHADASLGLIDERRAELLAQIRALGRRVYAEKPKAFARRIGRYVKAARAGDPVPA